ncbi:MAG TPA: hypothetical protein VFU22_20785, partial [Roseiflexaceae bacterium]|nr:hypothetical protein [Roseiflexaceae bacterium]
SFLVNQAIYEIPDDEYRATMGEFSDLLDLDGVLKKQVRIREFIAEYNRRFGATVILTSHYMADVTALCERVIVIDHGKIVFDGDLSRLVERSAPRKIIRLELASPVDDERLAAYGQVQSRDGLRAELVVARQQTSQSAARLLAELPIADVTIEDPPIEEVIGELFAGQRAAAAPEQQAPVPEAVQP